MNKGKKMGFNWGLNAFLSKSEQFSERNTFSLNAHLCSFHFQCFKQKGGLEILLYFKSERIYMYSLHVCRFRGLYVPTFHIIIIDIVVSQGVIL